MSEITETTTDNAARAAEFRKQAQESRDRSARSFRDSDTDGFMSQWANDLTARELDMKADLAENGDTSEFSALFTVAGKLVNARRISTRYGFPWAVFADTDTEQNGEILAWINESSAKKASTRAAALARKGYAIGSVRARAYVKMIGSGTGMSGAMSVRPVVVQADNGRPSSIVEIVATSGADDSDY